MQDRLGEDWHVFLVIIGFPSLDAEDVRRGFELKNVKAISFTALFLKKWTSSGAGA